VRLGLLSLVVVALAACGSPDPDRVPGPETLEGQAPTLVDPVEVTIDGFEPAELSVDTNQAFELTNGGDEPVRVIGRLEGDQRYDTGSMAPGETTVIAFSEEGRFRFSVQGEPDAGTLAVGVELHPDDDPA
jgi:hypothetical protein